MSDKPGWWPDESNFANQYRYEHSDVVLILRALLDEIERVSLGYKSDRAMFVLPEDWRTLRESVGREGK